MYIWYTYNTSYSNSSSNTVWPFLCFSPFTCGLKALGHFQPLHGHFVEGQAARSHIFRRGLRYVLLRVQVGRVLSVARFGKGPAPGKEGEKKTFKTSNYEPNTVKRSQKRKVNIKWPLCVIFIVIVVFSMPRADSLSAGRADRISSWHNSGMRILNYPRIIQDARTSKNSAFFMVVPAMALCSNLIFFVNGKTAAKILQGPKPMA